VLLRKPRARTEIYNDLDGEITTLFRVLRTPHDAARLAELLELTPYSRDEYFACQERSTDPVEASRRMIARSFMSQSSKGVHQASGFDTRINPDGYCSRVGSLNAMPDVVRDCVGRLRKVVVENADAIPLIARFDRADCLIYCDPPYIPRAPDRGIFYRHEMTEPGHRRLADALLALQRAMVIVSGYPSELYDEKFTGWRRVECQTWADAAARRVECLWINPAAAAELDKIESIDEVAA